VGSGRQTSALTFNNHHLPAWIHWSAPIALQGCKTSAFRINELLREIRNTSSSTIDTNGDLKTSILSALAAVSLMNPLISVTSVSKALVVDSIRFREELRLPLVHQPECGVGYHELANRCQKQIHDCVVIDQLRNVNVPDNGN
jgi:hypothetical protein